MRWGISQIGQTYDFGKVFSNSINFSEIVVTVRNLVYYDFVILKL